MSKYPVADTKSSSRDLFGKSISSSNHFGRPIRDLPVAFRTPANSIPVSLTLNWPSAGEQLNQQYNERDDQRDMYVSERRSHEN
jgi:hypothetical protein